MGLILIYQHTGGYYKPVRLQQQAALLQVSRLVMIIYIPGAYNMRHTVCACAKQWYLYVHRSLHSQRHKLKSKSIKMIDIIDIIYVDIYCRFMIEKANDNCRVTGYLEGWLSWKLYLPALSHDSHRARGPMETIFEDLGGHRNCFQCLPVSQRNIRIFVIVS